MAEAALVSGAGRLWYIWFFYVSDSVNSSLEMGGGGYNPSRPASE